jgi:hypothetical protein
MGSSILSSVGKNGTFYYPKLDLIATAVLLKDVDTLPKAHARERDKVMFLRNNPKCIIQEKSPFKNVYINVHYDLEILSANNQEFKVALNSTHHD